MLGYQKHAFLQAARSLAKRYDNSTYDFDDTFRIKRFKNCVNNFRKHASVFSNIFVSNATVGTCLWKKTTTVTKNQLAIHL